VPLYNTQARGGRTQTQPSKPGSPFPPSKVLDPLRLACASGDPRILAPALGCLHKLVSHAYVQSESSPGGGLDDGTPVAALVSAAAAAAAAASAAGDARLQLSALRALLTAATADHFVPHGDALLACVRPAFALGVAGAGPDVRAAARGALLQTVAAVLKRVGDEPGRPLSRDPSSVGGGGGSTVALNGGNVGDGGHLFGGGAAAAPPVADEVEATTTSTATAAPPPPDLDAAMGTARAAQLASLADSADLGGLERALDALAADRAAVEGEGGGRAGGAAAFPAAPVPAATAAPAAVPAWHPPTRLTLAEKDAALLLTAIARIGAGPEGPAGGGASSTDASPGPSPSDPASAASRALALDLLIRAFSGAGHGWDSARRPLCEALRRPLTVALLKCAAAPPGDPSGAACLGPALLASAAGRPRVRAVLKAELGAFIPLLLLRPVEVGCDPAAPPDPPAAALALAALSAMRSAFADPSTLMDLFVNFDCDLGGPNLAERGMRAAARAAAFGGGGGGSDAAAWTSSTSSPPGSPAATAASIRAAGAAVLASAAISLEAWAAPLREEEECRDGGGGGGGSGDEPAPPGRARRASSPSAASLARLATLAPPASSSPTPPAALVATKARKHSLESGVAVFNRDPAAGVAALVASGCVPPDPAALASFLRSRPRGAVDPDALGELFGSPDDAHVAIMRAFIGEEGCEGVALDEALRALLARFRLPGEAQKIDRIVEAFASAYVSRNPASGFSHPDGAYLLAFALVMLNTDAHHPSAARGLGKADFVGMCQAPVVGEDGGSASAGGGEEYAPVLPPAELEAMYDRIVAREIAPPEGSAPGLLGAPAAVGGAAGMPGGRGSTTTTTASTAAGPARALATALGLPLGGRGRAWDKAAGAAHERARALEAARAALAAAGAAVVGAGGAQASSAATATTTPASHLWQPAFHAEHARPALQAGGDALVRGLGAALAAAPDAASAGVPLSGLAPLVRTAALLGLDALVEAGVDALASAAGAAPADAAAALSPRASAAAALLAPTGSARGGKQVAALEALLAAAAGPAAAGLGGGWLSVARTLSALDALGEAAAARGAFGSGSSSSSRANGGGGGSGDDGTPRAADAQKQPAPPPQPSPVHALPGGGLTGGPAADKAAGAPPAGPARSQAPPPPAALPVSTSAGLSAFSRLLGRPTAAEAAAAAAVAAAPPAIVAWASSPPGRAACAAVLAAGPRLPGDGALVFVRCLAARGQEELLAAPPRLWALHAVADAAAAAGGVDAAAAAAAAASAASGGGSAALTAPSTMLLRAVWSRVWAAAAGHLAAAACHPDGRVAGGAGARLAGLVDALLARRPPASPAAQEQALRPLVAIARGGARPDARTAAVNAAGRALALHGRSLAPPAWRAALAALAAGAADPAPGGGVVSAALDGVGPAVEALRSTGKNAAGVLERDAAVRGVIAVLGRAMRNPHPPGDALAIAAAFGLQAVVRCLADSAAGEAGGGDALSPPSPAPETAWDEAWAAFGVVARHDPRPAVADAALAAAVEVAGESAAASSWPPVAWRAFGGAIIRYALDLPCVPGWEGVGLAEDGTEGGWPGQGGQGEGAPPPPPHSSPRRVYLAPRPVGWSEEGAARLVRHLGAHARAAARLVCAPPTACAASLGGCLGPLLGLALRCGAAPDPRTAGLGAALLEEVVVSLGAAAAAAASLGHGAPSAAWDAVLSAVATACRADVRAGLTAGDGVPGAPPPPKPFFTPPGALGGGGGVLPPALAARAAARAAVAAHRAVGRALVRAAEEGGGGGPGPPPPVAAALVSELKAALARAASANAASRRAAAAAAAGDGPAPAGGDDNNPLPTPDPWAAPPSPALARQEVEAGAALLAALGARAAAGVPGAGGELAAAARGVLREAAAGLTAGGGDGGASPASAARRRRGGAPDPAAWVDAVRAPLIVCALGALGGGKGAEGGGGAVPATSLPAVAVAEVAPLAAAGHGGVRAALAALLNERVGPALV